MFQIIVKNDLRNLQLHIRSLNKGLHCFNRKDNSELHIMNRIIKILHHNLSSDSSFVLLLVLL